MKTLNRLRGVVASLLDSLVKYVPDVQPIVFDAERIREWSEMVELATVHHVLTNGARS